MPTRIAATATVSVALCLVLAAGVLWLSGAVAALVVLVVIRRAGRRRNRSTTESLPPPPPIPLRACPEPVHSHPRQAAA
jgi:hypothetical protein